MHSVEHNIISDMLMATSFSHNNECLAISQTLTKAGTYSAKSSIYMGSHLQSYRYLLTVLIVLIAAKYAIYSAMCSVVFCCAVMLSLQLKVTCFLN
jgi:hypothetical protein